ncbi:MAG: TIGR00730 family Rossman fold protein [Armatimonadota bacterium]|nr:TIGR00730 family Rossman fold protein [Armatimonadota bacterium]MDR7448455.1 TIGR00730 family Rossman fold protein [Armatimonadota bacterium]MDR7459534.1 TIGR00730 family Rossman fold protein [Armatimonadota bacterium]MDR7480378.1 TIGR00730 family Rossman fold protein [Armatimonadota bacterium]MDR7489595.1 TIGR00730 family Rossman fold protein [Armatimonadota bacterium]
MRRVCVFCGSSAGVRPAYAAAARALGALLARRGLGLVYGGGRVGMMGVLADAVLAHGGEVTGVIPRHLVEREVAHDGVSTLHVVTTMHERKARMVELADAFIALPGGVGTLEELFEVWAWAQLGLHAKPCGVLNVDGYYDTLQAHVARMVAEGFLRPEHGAMVVFADDPEVLLDRFADYVPPPERWPSRLSPERPGAGG